MQAFNAALRDAMTADDSVVDFREDADAHGGVFRITNGPHRAFGAAAASTHRCPRPASSLPQAGIVGMEVGSASERTWCNVGWVNLLKG
ncbi:hypothetical protein GCM10009608_84180 [Pseudonocardia alaniniphila]